MSPLHDLAHHQLRYTEYSSGSSYFNSRVPIASTFVEPTLVAPNGDTVTPAAMLDASRNILLVGDPGSGKTTLLRHLAHREAEAFLKGDSSARCPIYVAAHRLKLDISRDTRELVFEILAPYSEIHHLAGRVSDSGALDKVVLYIDGLDEVQISDRNRVFRALQAAAGFFGAIICSSRPSVLSGWPPSWSVFNIEELGDEGVLKYLALVSCQHPERAERFLTAVRQQSHLRVLAKNPLLLTLLWQLFEARGRLPGSRAFLYGDISDYLLSTWDRQKGIESRSQLTIEDLHHVLERLAITQFERGTVGFTRGEALELIASVAITASRDIQPLEILDRILTTGTLVSVGADSLGFTHLSFMEYFAAKALSHSPEQLIHLIDKPYGHEIVLFACGMVRNVGPLVEVAVQRRQLLLAAKCISNGRLENQKLGQYVVQEFRREVGNEFFTLITKTQNQASATPDVYDELMLKWSQVAEKGLSSFQKGRRLEDFAKLFFGQCFTVVKSDLNTENGEIDIILENKNLSPFWLEFGADLFVECKNWTPHAPLHEVGAFGFKAGRFGVRLAFFVAVSGFTADAIRSIRNQAAASRGPLIVPIVSDDIQRALEGREVLEEFLKERIREVKYLQKY